jgi:hypothetical protein
MPEATPVKVRRLGHVRAKSLEEAVAHPLPGVTYQ